MSHSSSKAQVHLRRVTPIGKPEKQLDFRISPCAASVTLKESDKEDLISFVQAFANRVAYEGIPVTHLTRCSTSYKQDIQWEHFETFFVMDEYLTSLSLRSRGPIKVPFLGVYFITQILVGEALLSEVKGLAQFPSSLVRRMIMLRFREQPLESLLFICQSPEDVQQITAALSLFRLVPRHDAAERLQAHIRRALVQRESTSHANIKHITSDLEKNNKTSDDISTRVDHSRDSSMTISPKTASTTPNVHATSIEDSDTPRIVRKPSLSRIDSATPDVSTIQLPSPSPRMTLFSPPNESSSMNYYPLATQRLIKAINEASSPKKFATEGVYPDNWTILSQGAASTLTAQVEWCCTPVRRHQLGDSAYREKPRVLEKHGAVSDGHSESTPREASARIGQSPRSTALPDLVLPINGSVTLVKRQKQREIRTVDHQVRIRDAHRQPFDLEITGPTQVLPPPKAESSSPPPQMTWKKVGSSEDFNQNPRESRKNSNSGEIGEGRTESTTGSRSIASGVVRVDLHAARKRDTQLAEVVYIPEEQRKRATWKEVLQPAPRDALYESSSKTSLSSEVERQPPLSDDTDIIQVEVLDSAISPLVKNRNLTETTIDLMDIEYSAQPPVTEMRMHESQQNRRYSRNHLHPNRDTSPLTKETRIQRSPRSDRSSHLRRRDTGTNDFTALFNKTELTESSWMPNISEDGEGTMTLLMAEKIDKMPGNDDFNLTKPDLVDIDDDAFSVSASQLGPGPRRQNSRLRLLSPLREDSGWQNQNTVRGQLSPLEKLKRAGHGLPTPFTQAAALRRSQEVPTLSARLNYSNA